MPDLFTESHFSQLRKENWKRFIEEGARRVGFEMLDDPDEAFAWLERAFEERAAYHLAGVLVVRRIGEVDLVEALTYRMTDHTTADAAGRYQPKKRRKKLDA